MDAALSYKPSTHNIFVYMGCAASVCCAAFSSTASSGGKPLWALAALELLVVLEVEGRTSEGPVLALSLERDLQDPRSYCAAIGRTSKKQFFLDHCVR